MLMYILVNRRIIILSAFGPRGVQPFLRLDCGAGSHQLCVRRSQRVFRSWREAPILKECKSSVIVNRQSGRGRMSNQSKTGANDETTGFLFFHSFECASILFLTTIADDHDQHTTCHRKNGFVTLLCQRYPSFVWSVAGCPGSSSLTRFGAQSLRGFLRSNCRNLPSSCLRSRTAAAFCCHLLSTRLYRYAGNEGCRNHPADGG